ncbi:hypothetical protein ILUMI_08596, partial [Ignelater luminosus]
MTCLTCPRKLKNLLPDIKHEYQIPSRPIMLFEDTENPQKEYFPETKGPEVTQSEVEYAIKTVKGGKALGPVYGENAVSERRTRERFVRFRSENFDVKDAPRSGRPVTEKADEILQMIELDRHASCQEI